MAILLLTLQSLLRKGIHQTDHTSNNILDADRHYQESHDTGHGADATNAQNF